MDCKETERPTEVLRRRSTDENKKAKLYKKKKTILPVVNPGSPDIEYLHYRIYVEGDTLKVSLHRCQLI